MKIVRVLWNSVLLVVTVCIMGVALLNFLSAPDGRGLFGYKGYTVLSGSMKPAISSGDYILVSMSSYDELEEGDIVTFQESNETLVTHRAVTKMQDGWVTKGDANDTEDIQHVPAESLIGEVRWIIPSMGSVLLFMRQPFFIISLMVILIVSLLISYYRSGTEETVSENE